MIELTHARLLALLDYSPTSGQFKWAMNRGAMKVGDPAGYWSPSRGGGYLTIRLDGILYNAHRLAWLYVNGELPAHQIDHINGNGRDNRIANLRDVTNRVNRQNMRRARSDSKSGVIGATWHRAAGKWRARIRLDGKETHLGLFETAEDAQAAYIAAKRAMHDGCSL